MEVTVKYFGIIAEFTHKKEEIFILDANTNSIHSLQKYIEELYPDIQNDSYSLALNQKLTNRDESLNNKDEIALLPPFAGG